jgi:tetratricopeptide repeat protein
MRTGPLVAALLLTMRSLSAQTPDSIQIYAKIVEENPENSHAVFRLAKLRPRGSAEAVALFERYVRLEPTDARGHLALAEAYADAGKVDAARATLVQAEHLAPDATDIPTVKRRIDRAQRNRAPAVQPRFSVSRDSDGNLLTQVTAASDIATGPSTRVGATIAQSKTGNGVVDFGAFDGRASFQYRTPALRLDATGGAAVVQSPVEFLVPVGRVRLRWRPAPDGPLVDLRAGRAPMLALPLLMSNRAVLNEARGTVELPLRHNVRARAQGQYGSIATGGVITNTRAGFGGGIVTRINPILEVSPSYSQLSYQLPAQEGYFAPRFVRSLEVGGYGEVYRFDPLSIAFDVGVGVQRVTLFRDPGAGGPGGGPGPTQPGRPSAQGAGGWTAAFRGWSQVTLAIGRSVELNLETEAYRSQLDAVTSSGSWSSFSSAMFLRILIL